MTITPTGLPAWVKANDHTSYGGHVNKKNYQSQGTVNPRTDLSAENLTRIAADLAAIHRVAPFCVMQYTVDDTAQTVTINSYSAMAGSEPTATWEVSSARFDWDASYSDEYGIDADIHIIGALATVMSNSADYASARLFDADANGKNERVDVYPWQDTGLFFPDATITLSVWTGPV